MTVADQQKTQRKKTFALTRAYGTFNVRDTIRRCPGGEQSLISVNLSLPARSILGGKSLTIKTHNRAHTYHVPGAWYLPAGSAQRFMSFMQRDAARLAQQSIGEWLPHWSQRYLFDAAAAVVVIVAPKYFICLVLSDRRCFCKFNNKMLDHWNMVEWWRILYPKYRVQLHLCI